MEQVNEAKRSRNKHPLREVHEVFGLRMELMRLLYVMAIRGPSHAVVRISKAKPSSPQSSSLHSIMVSVVLPSLSGHGALSA
eukprot:scaffold94871_cov32-Tisochrysis_lutea.AAC.2